MSDDNTFDAAHEEDREGIVEQPAAGQDASDHTPASTADPDAATPPAAPDHSAWRRPEEGGPQRTSEVVGAIHDDTPAPVHSLSRSGSRRAPTPAERARHAEQAETPAAPEPAVEPEAALPAHQMGALIGARAAQARRAEAGASLAHEPEVLPEEAHPGRPAWMTALPWLAGAAAAALVVGGVVFAATRKPVVVVTPTPTPSVSTPEPVTDASLLSAAEAEKIAPKQDWKVASTVQRLTTSTPRIACLASTTGQPNPTATRQRTLTTTAKSGLAALHQVDGYANVAEAQKAFQMRANLMATCNDVPTWLAGADKVTGLGDESTSVTIAYQDPVTQYHTLVLTRTGRVLQAFDVSQSNQAFPVKQVLAGASGVVNRACTTSGGACAKTADSTPTGPAATLSPGWLVPSDIQRVTPGAGLWSSTDTQAVTTSGSQCENMNLASVAGPTKREQRTYQMTQDSTAPQSFGIDEVLMTFAKPADAQAFAKTLQTNLANCPQRLQKSAVSDAQNASTTIDGTTLTSSTQMVTLPLLNGAQTVRYRTAVVVNGSRVVYLVNNPGPSYDLGKDKFLQAALRAGQRAGQAR